MDRALHFSAQYHGGQYTTDSIMQLNGRGSKRGRSNTQNISKSSSSLAAKSTLLEDFPSIDGTIVSGSGSNTCRNFSMGSVLIVDDEVNPSINGTELMPASVILRNLSSCSGKFAAGS